ncbi:MAG: tetratricopeptide repeat protein [Candidatus Omnitrophica bacterium]|nr:tetratricopeptide repeat protein [Candidatus Omnitrophota bacterium]
MKISMKPILISVTILAVFASALVHADETTQKYTQLMEQKKGVAMSAFNKGLSYENNKEQLKAIDAYKQAIRLNPTVKEAYNNLGAIYADLGMYDKAIDEYKKAIEVDDTYSVAYFNLGMAYYALGRYPEAVTAFEKGGESSSQSKDPLYFLGRSYCHIGQYDKSIECLEKVLAYDPEFYPAHFDAACVYMITNKFNMALYHFHQVLLIAPQHENAERINTIIKNIEKIDLNRVELRSST